MVSTHSSHWIMEKLKTLKTHHLERQVSYFFKATLPLKPATIALKIGHKRLSRHKEIQDLVVKSGANDFEEIWFFFEFPL